MKINKWVPIVSAINIAVLGLAIYVFWQYQHRTSIVASQTPIANFSILEVNCRKLGSSVKIAYNGKEYYTALPIPYAKCKTENVEKLAYYYDAKNDAIFFESGLNKRHVVFYFIAFLFSLLLWAYPEVRKERRQAVKRLLLSWKCNQSRFLWKIQKSTNNNKIMKQTDNIDKALSTFKTLAATQVAATENGDYRKGNKAFKQIIKIIKYLKGLGRVSELEALLSDSNVGVRMFAAFGLLQTSPDVAVPILKEIAQREGIHSLTARTTLEEWESNTLIYPF